MMSEQTKEYIIEVYTLVFTYPDKKITAWFMDLVLTTEDGETEPVTFSMN